MARRLDGAGLVRVDVRARRAYDTCVLRGDGAEHGLVRLCASHEEPDVGLCGIAGLANFVCGRIAVLVLAIAGVLLVRHGLHAGDDLRGGGGGIIVFERQHMHSCSCGYVRFCCVVYAREPSASTIAAHGERHGEMVKVAGPPLLQCYRNEKPRDSFGLETVGISGFGRGG